MKNTIPFLDFSDMHNLIKKDLNLAFNNIIELNSYITGENLEKFENEFSDFCNVKYCAGVGNGLDALHLLLRAYDIKPGDEVLVPSHTFIATWLAVSHCGATPVSVDINIEDYNINEKIIEEKITKKTKAIIPVHLYGRPASMEEINKLAKKYNLVVIEDAAQAHGASYKNKITGSLGNAAAFSFYPGKNLGALGDGGAIVTNDEEIYKRVKELRNYGSQIKYTHDKIGFNSRLDEMQASFLSIKLKHINAWNQQRSDIASRYLDNLSGIPSINIPKVSADRNSAWHLFVIRHDKRDQLQKFLRDKGIQTLIHYPIPPEKQKCYYNNTNNIASIVSKQVLSLPIYPGLTGDNVDYISNCIKDFK